MTATLILGLASTMVATAFLSGIFGMAGGLVLMGVLLALLPLPAAMALHAVTQMASNGWRGLLWVRYVRWRAAAAFLAGCAVAFIVWMQWRYVPSKPVAFILLGLSPFVVRLVPADIRPDPERLANGLLYGSASMTLMRGGHRCWTGTVAAPSKDRGRRQVRLPRGRGGARRTAPAQDAGENSARRRPDGRAGEGRRRGLRWWTTWTALDRFVGSRSCQRLPGSQPAITSPPRPPGSPR